MNFLTRFLKFPRSALGLPSELENALSRIRALEISNERLSHELSKMQTGLVPREKMAAIGSLAAGICHDLLNPLGIIRGECEIFLLNSRGDFQKDKSSEETLRTFFETMKDVALHADRAITIVKRLAAFTKPSGPGSQEPVCLEKEVEEILGLMAYDLMRKNIRVHKEFPQGFPEILADRMLMDEALFHVLRNAVERSDKPEGRISIAGSVDGEAAIVRIEDNGCERSAGDATDLELLVLRQIMERLKGGITVQTRVGSGSISMLRLPVK